MRPPESLLPEKIDVDKSATTDQLLRYARDLAEIYQVERKRTKELEEANVRLQGEIAEREKAQKDLAESEERYRTLFQASRDAIYIADGIGTFIDVNKSFLGMFECLREDVVGRTTANLMDAQTYVEFQRSLLLEGAVVDHEIKLRKKDGTPIDCLISAILIRNEEGVIVRRQGIVRDITARKKMQQIAEQGKKMDALAEMAGGIAHEIRNPLAVASSAAQLLLDDDISEELRKSCAGKIVSGVQRTSLIIENLLALTRAFAHFDLKPLDISFLLRDSAELVAKQSQNQNIRFEFSCSQEPIIVSGNTALLTQALMNIYANAFDAMKKGGILSVSVCRRGQSAEICISDTGHGIPKEHLDKVFDLFFTRNSPGKGQGLGLSAAYFIIQKHSGMISVESVENQGTTFKISIPTFTGP
jgi:PAS domain S-box-containing protein